MAEKSSNQKTTQHNVQDSHRSSAAGPEGAALAPPTYEMDFLKQAPIVQRKTEPANNTGLPDALKNGVESLSGFSLDDVRVHYNSSKPAELQALAYAQGTDIHLGPGQERHLPHEAWHVVQQKQRRVQPTVQAKGVAINDNKGLEREADLMGLKASQMRSSQSGVNASSASAQSDTIVQRAKTNLLHTSPVGNVAQLSATKLGFSTDLTGRHRITSTHHIRSGVHKMAVDWVLDNGAWKTVPGGETCNHSKAYDSAAQEILNEIHGKKLYKAAETVKGIYETLQDNDKGIGNATSTHKNRLKNVIDDPDEDVNGDDIVDSFNYYMYKICDYPANLFFWPNRTGGNPDNPQGEYGDDPTNDWEVRNGIISNKTRLSREQKRLTDGRKELNQALP